MPNPWTREPDDDADNTEIVIGTCRDCGAPCRVEDDWCPVCWRKRRENNDAIVTRHISDWFRRTA